MPLPVKRDEPEFVRMGTGPAGGTMNRLVAVKVNADGTVSMWQSHEDTDAYWLRGRRITATLPQEPKVVTKIIGYATGTRLFRTSLQEGRG